MTILAIDGASPRASLALAGDNGVRETLCEPNQPAQRMLSSLIAFCRDHGNALGAIERVAVATGPGSFTGLRCALVLARTLALTRRIPCHGVSTFRARAARAIHGGGIDRGFVCSVAETRRDTLFAQLFTRRGHALAAPLDVADPAFAALAPGEPLWLTGDGLAEVGARLSAAGRSVRVVEEPRAPTLAAVIAVLVAEDRRHGLPPSPASAPLYLASPVRS